MAERFWRAVLSRDQRADGVFVYAVRSTGIYCHPSCPSRKPARDRVEFFAAPAMAVARGYRACKRCRPDRIGAGSPVAGRVAAACRAIAADPARRWSLTQIARAAGGSVVQVQRASRSLVGITPHEYVLACRRQRFMRSLRSGQSVTDATFSAGFGSSSRMYSAVRLPGMRPSTYGQGGRGATIEWTITASPVGRILVAATSAGVCFVEIGDTDSGLLSSLHDEFPRAAIAASRSSRLAPYAATARAIAAGERPPDSVPVDIRGTAFQWKVWRALTDIPGGRTKTYAELAKAVGKPLAVRAVARACATNPLSLVIPCHRVIGSDGTLRGYRWGIEVKRALLAAERPVGSQE
jgi:AraC family transcriptional regulator of adaptative response/methylated-DNA-[protein]-cysteine methyltransferase